MLLQGNEDVKLFYHDNFNNFDILSEKLENINVDLIDVTKNLYSDTNFINQLINKNIYQNCIKCSFCNQKLHFNNKICCAINPHLVDFDNLKINGDKKEVAVVGSGLSGLICSMILAKRNYIVHLYEQNSEVNHIGKLMTIFGTNKSLESYHKYIENELDKYIKNKQIVLFLNTKFKPSIEKNHHYNSIVIATGFIQENICINGAVQNHVKSIYDVLDSFDENTKEEEREAYFALLVEKNYGLLVTIVNNTGSIDINRKSYSVLEAISHVECGVNGVICGDVYKRYNPKSEIGGMNIEKKKTILNL